MTYLLDANIFVEAKKRYYGFDVCPGFWKWLIAKNREEKIFSIEKVRDEMIVGNDDLSEWVDSPEMKNFFINPNEELLPFLERIGKWLTPKNYTLSAKNIFLHSADYYLVAQALAGKYTVVTHEVHSNSPKKVKIPDVCLGVGVGHITTFEMLRRENARFILDKGRKP